MKLYDIYPAIESLKMTVSACTGIRRKHGVLHCGNKMIGQELRDLFREKNIRKHLIFSGRVQGVGFRYRAMNIAQMLGLTGWVKNRWDGKVEMEVQGKREEIGKLISMLYQQRFIWIEDIEEKEIPVEKESSFSIH